MHGDDALLSNFLVDAGLLSRSQLADALERTEGRPLAYTLAEMGVLGADDVRRAQAHALGVPFVTLSRHDISTEAMLLIPEPLARAHNMFAYNLPADRQGLGATVEVAVLDLGSLAHATELQKTHRIVPRLTTAAAMREALVHYQKHLKEKFGELLTAGAHVGEALIRHALYSRAGGVHIEPAQLGTMVRYQLGHALHEAFVLPHELGAQLVGQLKALAKLLPVARVQEGKFKVEKDGEVHHVRVHSLPTSEGDRIHMRIARASPVAGLRPRGYMLESLGLHGQALQAVERRLHAERGLVVVAGPMGAGKTTFLKTLEDLLASPHRTVLYAASAAEARAALRHDPHVLIVDDLHDEALAALAASAAGRGVLVASALELGPESVEKVRSGPLGQVLPFFSQTPDLVVMLGQARRLANDQFRHYAKLSRAEVNAFAPHITPARLYDALKEEQVIESGAQWKDIVFAHPTPSAGHPSGYEGHIGLQEVHEGGEMVGLNIIEDGLFKAAQGQTSVEEVQALLS